jgi:allantoinase
MLLSVFAGMLAGNAAARFGIDHRNEAIEPGCDADFTFIEQPACPEIIERSSLRYRHKLSPYIGRWCRAKVRRVIRRGETIFLDGEITARTSGQLITPRRHD